MRVWDIPVSQLCNKHLVAQHHEIHCIYSIITNGKKGFAHHPEVERWRDNLPQLWIIHELTVYNMRERNYQHKSPMPVRLESLEGFIHTKTIVSFIMPDPWQPVEEQIRILKAKGCDCHV